MKQEPVAATAPTVRSAPARWLRVLPAERRALLVVGDVALLGLAAVGTALLSRAVNPGGGTLAPAVTWNLGLALVLLVLTAIAGAHELTVALLPRRALPGILAAAAGTGVAYLVAFFVTGRPIFVFARRDALDLSRLPLLEPPRLAPAAFLGVGVVLMILWRYALARLLAAGALRHRALVVGAGASAQRLLADLGQVPHHYLLLGMIDDDPAKADVEIAGLGVLCDRRRLVETAERLAVQEVILATTGALHPEMLEELIRCWELGIAVRPMPAVYEELTGRVPVEHLGQKWFLAPFWDRAGLPALETAAKRIFDLVVGGIGLAIALLLAPFVAVAIKLDSPGPVLYVQERLGRAGRPFRLIKFRSMRHDAEPSGEARWARRGDPRITRVGAVIRRIRLDEVPQFWNVVRGEMSVVGPRPERAAFIERLEREIPFYRMRLAVKPGMTGWAQIRYPYGSSTEDALRKLEYDLYYVKNQSLSFDLVILARTLGVVLALRGS